MDSLMIWVGRKLIKSLKEPNDKDSIAFNLLRVMSDRIETGSLFGASSKGCSRLSGPQAPGTGIFRDLSLKLIELIASLILRKRIKKTHKGS